MQTHPQLNRSIFGADLPGSSSDISCEAFIVREEQMEMLRSKEVPVQSELSKQKRETEESQDAPDIQLLAFSWTLEMTWESTAGDILCSQEEDNYKKLEFILLLFLLICSVTFILKAHWWWGQAVCRRYVVYLLFSTCSFLLFFQDEQIDWSKRELTVSEIQHKVKEYNAQTNSNLYMVVVSPIVLMVFVRTILQT